MPFCGHHCGYCDFAVAAGQDHLIELYLDALELEFRAAGGPAPVESLFIGGGTPTYLDARQLARLLDLVTRQHPLAPPPGAAAEFTIESTPESLDEEKARILASFGVNRISTGVQSFHAHVLAALERRHGAGDVPRVVDAVRRHIPALSFDLIFGAPGQTPAEWEADLRTALSFAPDHLSTYGLTYEKGTPLWKDRERGRVRPVSEDVELEMYLHAIDRLGGAGFEHYEISNFARPGRRSVHNQRYWANEAYYGSGVGAARYVRGHRELNVRDTKLYVRKVLSGEPPTFQTECLGPRDRAFETVGTQLRRADGIARDRFLIQTGFDLDALLGDRMTGLIAHGLLDDTGTGVILTRRGKCVADGVIEELMMANPADSTTTV
ncbi:radical SAM family enzyme [Fimbriiglobus ruber]|uniref:Heme chaperone HemW n=1 Tax=Fimbriiglobus ruber TaxID=1908690 RepID=A0A225DR17_9BACT|nr:radical SAM family enzyme [Fimbriiglobus ruber]